MDRITALFFVWLLLPTTTFAADVYMSTTGTKTSGKSIAGNWTNANCYNNLQAAMSAMSSGDVLTIDDGIYNKATDVIQTTDKPPNGPGTGEGDAKYTIVKARNIPCQNGVACAQPLKVIFGTPGSATETGIWQGSKVSSSYVKFEGLWFKQTQNIWGPTHWYFKQCAVQGDKDGNNPGISVDETDYTIFEDFIINGKGRFNMVWFDDSYTGKNTHSVCRRCIARQDYVDAGYNDPIGGFVIYHHHGVALLNSIVIDGDPNYWVTGSAIQAAFSEENNEDNQEFTIQGSLAINDGKSLVFSQHNGATGINLIDVAGINIGGGVLYSGTSSNRVTMAHIRPDNFTYQTNGTTFVNLSTDLCGADGCGWGYYSGGSPQQSINDSIIVDTGTAVAQFSAPNFTGNNLNYYNTSLGTYAGTKITTNPFTNGLLYPVRIETGSPLATAGNGGQVGANILQKLGIDGTEYGSTDWNTPQGNLWPWPLEEWVKAQMAAADTVIGGDAMPAPTRGFASATAKRLDGINPVTLTSYIWESLGNQIPPEIYGGSAPPTSTAHRAKFKCFIR